ncbi:MAG: T9SS type A sorting domain-containing protein [Candidatus Marinimicrobia bacterium]|nr:T9SS type A sorting domain-containing protein [Candidatus Neomarinimicrobiota bacterium]
MSHPELQGQGSVTHRTEYTFTDNTVEVDQTYDYRLADVSFEGIKEYHTLYVLDVSPVSTPSNFWVQQNFPNPFNPVTTIEYDLPEDSNLKLAIYDILGREVIELSNGYQEAGYKSIQWNGRNTSGQLVSAGMYFYAIEAGKHSAIRKMVLLK